MINLLDMVPDVLLGILKKVSHHLPIQPYRFIIKPLSILLCEIVSYLPSPSKHQRECSYQTVIPVKP